LQNSSRITFNLSSITAEYRFKNAPSNPTCAVTLIGLGGGLKNGNSYDINIRKESIPIKTNKYP